MRLSSSPDDAPVFSLSVSEYSPRNTHIRVTELING
jgi:hypothetical protein